MSKEYLTTAQTAENWGVSERTVRNYCNTGRVPGAFFSGKSWRIPIEAKKPERKKNTNELLNIIQEQKEMRLKGGIYHKIQIELTYNSNHIEGSRLTHDQTRYIYETNTIGVTDEALNVDDIIETTNHFRCIDKIIDCAEMPISENLIKELHSILKTGTADSRKDWFAVGDYKRFPNEVADRATTPPENVHFEISKLIKQYNKEKHRSIEDIIAFHVDFERIHPFQDGNGRIGRLILFKECLKNNIVPFIIDDNLKLYYYRGLKEWSDERGYLIDTCLSAQDKFKTYLDYFKIPYTD